MNFYSLIRTSQSFGQAGDTIQGPAVANLISSIKTMFGRGAPTQWDDTGFNKIDHSDPMLAEMSYLPISNTTPIKIKDAVRAIGMLMKYKKRQLPNWQDLYNGIQELIDAKTGTTPSKDLPSDKIVYKGKNKYGKLLFYIPNLGRKLTVIQGKIGETTGDPRNAWKLFSAVREAGLDIYQVDKNVISKIAPMLLAYKYDILDMEKAIEEEAAARAAQEPQEAKPGEVEKPKQEVQTGKRPIQKVELLYNGTLIVSLGQWSDAWNRVIQELKKDNKIGYNKDGHARVFYEPNVQVVDALINAIKNEFDVRPLEEIKGKLSAAPEKKPTATSEKGVPLQVENVMANTKDKWQLAFTYGRKGSRDGEDLKDIIKFMFPVYGRDGQRYSDGVPSIDHPFDPSDKKDPDNPYKHPDEKVPGIWKYMIRGNYNQYRQVGATFKKYGFDVSQFNKIVAELVNTGIVKPTRVEGDLDGYQKEVSFTDAAGNKRKTKVNDNDKFLKELDGYKKKVVKDGKEIDFELYPLQKIGVAFLYGHKSALLGDATGGGKTNQTIIAADMRLKMNGGSCLIITLNDNLQEQWAAEIGRFAQYKPEDISLDPNVLATWTILRYPMLQTIQTREETTAKLQSYVREGKITCFILDECHSVKNSGAARTENTQNISSFTDEKTGQEFSIPFVWGASATVVANRPIDVYNQLKAINHPLGKLSFGTFAQELGGMKKGRYGMEDAPIEEQVRAANKLKEWLINFGVYVARTKKDMREDMPNLEIEDVDAQVDNVNLYNCIGAKVSGYKNPDLPISVMIATRDCLALSKAPHSVELAAPILREGKKVMIFTAFKAAANHLINGLQQVLDSMGSGGQVGSILGGMHKKTRSEYIQQFKDPNSPIKAMVLMIQAGGTGLDFPNVTNDVIENDFDWTPAASEQMRGRAWRITSKNPVKVKSVVAAGTEDEDFKDRVVEKINIADIIIKLTKEQLELFSLENKYKDEKVVKRLGEIEKEMIDAVKKEAELEEGEGAFQQQMANQIREKIGGPIDKSIVAKNKSWYKKAIKK